MSGRTGWTGYLGMGRGIDHLTVPKTGGINPSKGRNSDPEWTPQERRPPWKVDHLSLSTPFSRTSTLFMQMICQFRLAAAHGQASVSFWQRMEIDSKTESFFRFDISNPKVCAHSTRRWRSSTKLFPMIRAMIGWCHGRQRRWCGLQKNYLLQKLWIQNFVHKWRREHSTATQLL